MLTRRTKRLLTALNKHSSISVKCELGKAIDSNAEKFVNTVDDKRLLNSLRAGCPEAYSEVVRAQYKTIYRFLFHMLRDVHRAEDLTQETFAAAWECIATFQGRSSLATWLHRIAYTKFIDAQRTQNRRENLTDRLTNSALPPVDPLESAIAVDESKRLYRALEQLAANDRMLLVLHYLQGLSYREMAEVLDEPSGTVKWRIREALKCLRVFLKKEVLDHATPKTL